MVLFKFLWKECKVSGHYSATEIVQQQMGAVIKYFSAFFALHLILELDNNFVVKVEIGYPKCQISPFFSKCKYSVTFDISTNLMVKI